MRQIRAARYASDRRSPTRGFPLSILETRLQETNDRRFIDRAGAAAQYSPFQFAENAQFPSSQRSLVDRNSRSAAEDLADLWMKRPITRIYASMGETPRDFQDFQSTVFYPTIFTMRFVIIEGE